MLSTALRTLRARWVAFIGSFTALALGVGLIATTGLALASGLRAPHRGPERFAAAAVVVHGADTLRVPTPIGTRTAPLSQPRPVPPELIAALAKLGTVTADRSFAVTATDAPGGSSTGTPTVPAAPADLAGPPHPNAPGNGDSAARPDGPRGTAGPNRASDAPGPGGSAGPAGAAHPDAPVTDPVGAVGPNSRTSRSSTSGPNGSVVPAGSAHRGRPSGPAGPSGPADRSGSAGPSGPAGATDRGGPSDLPGSTAPGRSVSAASAASPNRHGGAARSGVPSGLVGHPWASAGFGAYRVTAGRAPAAADEVAVSGGWTVPGQRLVVRAGGTVGTVTVVGTVAAARAFEQAVFFTDAEAARLSPRADDVVVAAPAAAVRSAVEAAATAAAAPATAGVRVLTGEDRRQADPDRDSDHQALVSVDALLGTAAGVTCFVSVFVVASTFAFSVAQRRRELGLLRMAGATPRQVRGMVFAEAFAIGVPAAAAGCLLGRYGAPRLAGALVAQRVAPEWFTVGGAVWPYWTAFGTGLLVVLAGVWAAGRRAGRIAPTEALRDAAVDSRTMTPGRWVAGGALLLGGGWLAVSGLVSDPGEALHRKSYTVQPLVLITAVALLAPVVVGPLTRLLAWLPGRLRGATWMLAGEHAAAGLRRTAAVAAPVLVTVALAGSLLGAAATVDAAKASEVRGQTGADFVVTAEGSSGLPATAVARVAAVPGVNAAALAATTVYTLEDGVALTTGQAQAVTPAALAKVAHLPLVAGRLAALDDGGIVVNQEWARHTVGQRVRVWLGDGTPRSLRIVAVLRQGTGDNGVYVTPANGAGAPVNRIDVALRPGADRAAVARAVRAAVAPVGGQVRTARQWLAARYPRTSRQTRIGFRVVLGIALLYTAIALADTMVMATSDRLRELAVLRLSGATVGQVLRLLAAEAVLVVAAGAVLGTLVTVLDLARLRLSLAALSVPGPVVVPWSTVGAVIGACAALAVISTVAAAGVALYRPAAHRVRPGRARRTP
jgi:putative ABC transport system permease protein